MHLKKFFVRYYYYLHLERSSLFVCYFKPYFLVHCYFLLNHIFNRYSAQQKFYFLRLSCCIIMLDIPI